MSASEVVVQQSSSPRRRPFLTAQWRTLAMLNYEVDPDLVRPLAPRGTEIDFWEGRTYVSVVGFLFLGTRVLGIPLPFHRDFEEVNLRYYLRRETAGEVRRGVAFVKEIVPRWAIAKLARWAYNENYVALPMRHRREGFGAGEPGPRRVEYAWRQAGRWQRLSAEAEGNPQPLAAGSHEEFIAEHYWGYCGQRDGGTIEYQVEHPPWRVWRASEASLECDAEQLYGAPFADVLSRPPASVFIADGSPVTVYRPARIA